MNPVNLFRSAERNQGSVGKNNSSNIFYALETYWKPLQNLTLYCQFLLDDIDFEKELRRTYPGRLGYSAKLILTDFLVEGSQLYTAYNRIDSWTYISFRSWENYTYNGKSMEYPYNNVENFRVGLDYFGRPPFIFSSFLKYEMEQLFYPTPLTLDWRSYENMDHIFGKNEKDFLVSLNLFANVDLGTMSDEG